MNTSVAARTENPVAKFSAFMDKFKPQMALALPKHLTADRMARLALTAFSTNEALQNCTPHSIAASIMTASTLGLEPGVNGQGYLIPYKGTCTFVPGWKGLVDIANRSGRCTVWTGAVFDGDDFDYQLGDSPFVRHRPGDEDDPAKLIFVYAVGRVNGSSVPVIEVWPISKVQKHRDKYNKVGAKHYSFRDWEMYARKVPLLQVLKYMPSSIELSNALATTHAAEAGHSVTIEGNFVTVHGEPGEDEGVTAQSGHSEGTAPAKPALTDEDLAKRKTSLTKALAGGQSVNDVIAALSTKHTLTDDQRVEIASWAHAANTEGAQE